MRLALASLLVCCGLVAGGCGADGPSSTSREPTGAVLSGDGYYYGLPKGYAPKPGASASDDPIALGPPQEEVRPNIVALHEEDVPDGVDIAAYVDLSIDRFVSNPAEGGFPDGTVTVTQEPEEATLDGEEARRLAIRIDSDQLTIEQQQIVAIHDGKAYFVGLTSGTPIAEEEVAAFDEVVETWQWE